MRRRGFAALAFEAGKHGRRLRALPTTAAAINALIRTYGRTAQARSRYLCVNNPYGSAAKESYVSNMIGTGIKPAWRIDDREKKRGLQRAFLRWTDESDADGLTDFYGQQAIIAGELFEAGECFVRRRDRFVSDGLSVPLQLQIIPSEMLPFDHNETLRNGNRIVMGVEFDAIGRRVAYHFLRNHPGDLVVDFSAAQKVRVPASEILHIFRPIRAGQVRGVPHTLASMTALAMVDLYDDGELERKRSAALYGAFVTRAAAETGDDEQQPFADAPETPHDDVSDISDFSLEPGAVIDLAEGQDIKFAEPADVGGSYEPFQYRNLTRIAAGFGVTYADMTGDLRQTSYGSQRAGMVKTRRKIEADQHHFIVFQLCRPVAKWFMERAMLVGAIEGVTAAEYDANPRDYLDIRWIPPRWEWIDPMKDRMAEKLAVDSGFKPRSDVIEAEGYDADEVDEQIRADQERAKEKGIEFIRLSSSIVVAPGETNDETFVDTESESVQDFDFG